MDVFGGTTSSLLGKQNNLLIDRLNMDGTQLKLHSSIIATNCEKIESLFKKTFEMENKITSLENSCTQTIQNYVNETADNHKKTTGSIDEIRLSLNGFTTELKALQKVIPSLISRVNTIEVSMSDKIQT